ncbi:hypothetical protein [Tepidibacter sp. Z1-5]|uniref:hypothetical protein n=1 Tax=Tepidibacter sp. Z1-5 TaxID=3134138 RepID=UPI0030BB84EE
MYKVNQTTVYNNPTYYTREGIPLDSNGVPLKCKDVNKSVEKLVKGSFQELKAKDNVIDIQPGVNYKVKTLIYGYAEVQFDNEKAERWLFDQVNPNIDATKVFSRDELDDICRTNTFLSCFRGKDADEMLLILRTFVPESKEVLVRFQNLGIKVGEPFEVKGYSEKLFLDKNGWVFKCSEIDGFRKAYNERNYFEFGYTKESKFIMDGEEFHLDSTGHLNIPEGTICTPCRVETIK